MHVPPLDKCINHFYRFHFKAHFQTLRWFDHELFE